MQLAMPLAELTWQGRLTAADLCALTSVLGTPVHPCDTFTLDRRARLPLAHAASLSKLRGHHVDLRYPWAWRCREWQGMWSSAHAWMAGLARYDCRPFH
jgi:hypothetical protein